MHNWIRRNWSLKKCQVIAYAMGSTNHARMWCEGVSDNVVTAIRHGTLTVWSMYIAHNVTTKSSYMVNVEVADLLGCCQWGIELTLQCKHQSYCVAFAEWWLLCWFKTMWIYFYLGLRLCRYKNEHLLHPILVQLIAIYNSVPNDPF